MSDAPADSFPTPSDEPKAPPALLLSFARLMRLPNVFTALADIGLGFFFTHAITGFEIPLELLAPLGCLLAASANMYTAGMILNDVYDVDIDRVERPQRPLPSGAISVSLAHGLGLAMLLFGCGLGWVAAMLSGQLRAGAIATCLAVLVFLYDFILKRTFVGPVAMGGCRMLNVLLGMSISAEAFGPSHLLVAGGLGVYILGVTWFAKKEAEESNPVWLMLATAVMAAGIVMIAAYPQFREPGEIVRKLDNWYIMLGFVSFVIGRRLVIAILDPLPQHVQAAVKNCLLSLIVLDATALMAMRDWRQAVAIVLLLIPTLILGKWVYST
jgi:4-hydroxybenzoate polyprenyltransferase